MSYTLTLPYLVSTNVLWRVFKRKPVLSARDKAYKAAQTAEFAMTAGMTPFAGDVPLDVTLHAKQLKKLTGARPRCINLSNSIKVAEDR